jgi:hypothetical protein
LSRRCIGPTSTDRIELAINALLEDQKKHEPTTH